jgi:hypothetical protein
MRRINVWVLLSAAILFLGQGCSTLYTESVKQQ